MQALHRREAPAAAGRRYPTSSTTFSPINQRKKSPLCRSSGEDGDGLKAVMALADEAGAAGMPASQGAWGCELGLRTSVLLSSEPGGRWHTLPATLLPAVLRHEQALSLAPPFLVQQLRSHPDSKPMVGAGEGNRGSEGDLSLHTLRQRCFRLK